MKETFPEMDIGLFIKFFSFNYPLKNKNALQKNKQTLKMHLCIFIKQLYKFSSFKFNYLLNEHSIISKKYVNIFSGFLSED